MIEPGTLFIIKSTNFCSYYKGGGFDTIDVPRNSIVTYLYTIEEKDVIQSLWFSAFLWNDKILFSVEILHFIDDAEVVNEL